MKETTYRPVQPGQKNPLRTREDLASCLRELLEPVKPSLVAEGTRVYAGSHGTSYSIDVAGLEGWSRLLWGLAPLAAGGKGWDYADLHLNGLRYGTDPTHPLYWGAVHDNDQRSVEMAAISLALLIAPEQYWHPLSQAEKANTVQWLSSINSHELAKNNWYFFRVLVNLALERLGAAFDAERREADLQFLEDLYSDEGWYRDAVPYDNYNPFAFHFYSLIYTVFKADEDRERCDRFRKRSELFAQQFINFFDADGCAVPYGRSLTYRFALVSFFSACAFAGLEVLPWGVMKGIVLRHLRSWFGRPIFDRAGLLTVGYGYESLFHSEQYNAPGSPYWALKSFLPLALGDDHPFWQASEEALPAMPKTTLLSVPGFLFQRTKDDTVLLNAGQYPDFELNNAAAKYAKFAYSAHYGFSVSLSSWGLDKTGCDSMLFLREAGDAYWRERRACNRTLSGKNYLASLWHPWKDVAVRTWLIPFENAHVRIHCIESGRDLEFAEGGFSLPLDGEGSPLCLIDKSIVRVSKDGDHGFIAGLCGGGRGDVVFLSANLNLLFRRALVPVVTGGMKKGLSLLACVVYAGKEAADESLCTVRVEAETGGGAELVAPRCIFPDGNCVNLPAIN